MNELGHGPWEKGYEPSGISKAEERALQAYPEDGSDNWIARPFFEEGYEQAEKDLGWISVKDKLPGPSEWVVVCIEQHGHAQCLALATYNHETKEWHTADFEDGEQETVYVDYWMPIPNIINDTKK